MCSMYDWVSDVCNVILSCGMLLGLVWNVVVIFGYGLILVVLFGLIGMVFMVVMSGFVVLIVI